MRDALAVLGRMFLRSTAGDVETVQSLNAEMDEVVESDDIPEDHARYLAASANKAVLRSYAERALAGVRQLQQLADSGRFSSAMALRSEVQADVRKAVELGADASFVLLVSDGLRAAAARQDELDSAKAPIAREVALRQDAIERANGRSRMASRMAEPVLNVAVATGDGVVHACETVDWSVRGLLLSVPPRLLGDVRHAFSQGEVLHVDVRVSVPGTEGDCGTAHGEAVRITVDGDVGVTLGETASPVMLRAKGRAVRVLSAARAA